MFADYFSINVEYSKIYNNEEGVLFMFENTPDFKSVCIIDR